MQTDSDTAGTRRKGTGIVSMLLLSALCLSGFVAAENNRTGYRPGRPWADTEGTHINAHGFCILKHGDKYLWYGSHKIEGRTESEKNEAGVRCYVSDDLLNWKNAGMVFSVDAEGQHPEVAKAGILDRPKVIFNQATGKFVMHFKLYPPHAAGGTKGTDVAYVGVATSTDPLGPFAYQGKYTGAGSPNGSGDFALYQDEDGAAYHIAVRKPDKALVVGRLSDDGLRPAGDYKVMEGVTHATEAPAMFKRNGKYHLLGSGSTGWAPNAARMFVADQLSGPYTPLGNPCVGVNPHNKLGPEKTFGGQSTFVMPSPWKADEWIAMFDIWNPKEPIKAGYIWLPLRFENDKPVIRWQNEWKPEKEEAAIPRDAHVIAVNQVGYETGRSKRFTAPLSADGTPFIVRAASWVIDDPALKQRMREIAVSHADAIFGRNPRLAAAPNKPGLGFTGIERGWPKSYKDDVCARLELCRGSISSSPGSEMFPFHPGGSYRHPEGWVNYGAAWCLSLAYLEFDASGTNP